MDVMLLNVITFGFVIWHSYRVCAHHRLYWGGALFPPAKLWSRHIAFGVLAGAVVSVLLFFSGSGDAFTIAHIGWFWGTAVVLGAFRLRWMNVSTVVGVIGLLALVSSFVDASSPGLLYAAVASLSQLDIVGWLLLAGIATTVYGVVVIWQGSVSYCPVLLPRRGKAVGAFLLQSVTMFPIMDTSVNGWVVFPLPLVFSDIAVARTREQRARQSGVIMVCHGIVLTALAFVAGMYERFVWVCVLWALLVPEGITSVVHRSEHHRKPRFANVNEGIRVLDVAANSPAAEMGLRPGEIIKTVNGQAVHNLTDFYAAMKQSPAYCKLLVVDRWGEERFAQRALYAGESHQLGIIPVTEIPHDTHSYLHTDGWWHLLWRRTMYKRKDFVDTGSSVNV